MLAAELAALGRATPGHRNHTLNQTSLRFVRRLVLERRIPFIKVGRHVRIAASDLDAFIAAGRIEARTMRRVG